MIFTYNNLIVLHVYYDDMKKKKTEWLNSEEFLLIRDLEERVGLVSTFWGPQVKQYRENWFIKCKFEYHNY